MSTTTTSLTADRQTAIDEYATFLADYEAAVVAEDKSLAASLASKMAIRSARIHEAEFDLAAEGEVVEPWVKPTTAHRATKTRTAANRPQAEIEADLAKAARVYHNEAHPASIRKTSEQRIEALLKQATKAGYQVEDPRVVEGK